MPVSVSRLIVAAAVSVFTVQASDGAQSCALTANGKMICCPTNDQECITNMEKAHADPEPPPQVSKHTIPWFMTSSDTFLNSPVWDRMSRFDVAVVGVPFGVDPGVEGYGLQLVRRASANIADFSLSHETSIRTLAIVDVQDLLATGTSHGADRVKELEAGAKALYKTGNPVVSIGGDQSITVPLLRAAKEQLGKFALIHIDKDLAVGHGDRAEALRSESAMYWVSAQELADTRHSIHVGVRGNLPSQRVGLVDLELGFDRIIAEDVELLGVAEVVQRIKTRLTRRDGTFMPAYISMDLDVLDQVHVPGVTDEAGGLSVNQVRALLRGLRPFCRVVGAELRGVGRLVESASAVKVAAALAQDLILLAGRQHQLGTAAVPPQLQSEL